MDEINFGGSHFCDDAYVSHDAPAGAVSFEADHVARSCVGDGYMYAGVVIQRRTRGRANTQGGVIAIPNETTAIETGRGFPAAAVMGP